MDRGALWATVQEVAKSRTQLSDSHTHTHTVLQMGGKQEGGRKEEKDRHFISKEFLIILSFSSYPAYEVVITENFTDEETKVQRD